MGYRIKWLEENLGITRDKIRWYEKNKLIPENSNAQYREYSEDEVEAIWMLNVLQGIGFTAKEIKVMMNKVMVNDDFNFDDLISEKITQLEKKEKELTISLGYAKAIKLTGRYPIMPKEKFSKKFGDWHGDIKQRFNTETNSDLKTVEVMRDIAIGSTKNMSDDEIMNIFDTIIEAMKKYGLINPNTGELDVNVLKNKFAKPLAYSEIVKQIVRYIPLGPSHQKVQMLVDILYNMACEMSGDEINKNLFGRVASSSFLNGDISKLQEVEYSRNECDFLAEAFAIFAGYTGTDDPEYY